MTGATRTGYRSAAAAGPPPRALISGSGETGGAATRRSPKPWPVSTAVLDLRRRPPRTGRAVSAASATAVLGRQAGRSYTVFRSPQPVTIQGYRATAMEPFISRDDHYLLFNTSNQSADIAALQYATRVSNQKFTYQGAVGGTNELSALSGTPSMDDAGTLYFVSPRSYPETLSTVYAGAFTAGQVTGVHLVSGVTGGVPGTVDFDVEVSPDGASLYVSVGQFGGGSAPSSARPRPLRQKRQLLRPRLPLERDPPAVNKKGMLSYAASISTDGLELFFTRAKPGGGVPGIYRAVRPTTSAPFGHVQRVAAISGFAEAPSLSGRRFHPLLPSPRRLPLRHRVRQSAS